MMQRFKRTMINEALETQVSLQLDFLLPLVEKRQWADDQSSLSPGVRRSVRDDRGDPGDPQGQLVPMQRKSACTYI